MARPDTDDGFLMIALELFPALVLADFPRYQWVVLVSVLGPSFGPKKKVWHQLKASEIARLANVDPSDIRSAMSILTGRKVLIRNEDGLYRFNKAFGFWTPPINRTAQRFVDQALSLWTTFTSDKHTSKAREPRNVVNQPRGNEPRSGVIGPRNGVNGPGSTNPAQVRPPLESPIEDSRTSEDLRLKREKKYPPNPPKGGTSEGVIPFSRRDRTRQTPYQRHQARLAEGQRMHQAEIDAMSPEDLEAERQEWLTAIRTRYGQVGVDQALAEEAADRAKLAKGGACGSL